MEVVNMFKPKTKSRLKRTLSGALALAMTASLAAVMPAAVSYTHLTLPTILRV